MGEQKEQVRPSVPRRLVAGMRLRSRGLRLLLLLCDHSPYWDYGSRDMNTWLMAERLGHGCTDRLNQYSFSTA